MNLKAITNNNKYLGLALGILFLLINLLFTPQGIDIIAWRTLGVALLMATWWLTEAMPLPATAMIPIIFFPLLGINNIKDTALNYAHPIIFLFMGGFILGLAMQHTELHKRLAYFIISRFRAGPKALIFGFMIATAFLSMWISNTATTIMMLPIAISIITVVYEDNKKKNGENNFAISLVLSIAFAATIGGISTLIGTPPNAVMAGMLSNMYNYQISFIDWLIIGLPTTFILLPIAWFVLTTICFPTNKIKKIDSELILKKQKELGKISPDEIMVCIVFLMTATLWISRKWISSLLENTFPVGSINDSNIAIGAAIVLFMLPSFRSDRNRLISWKVATNIPWGVLILIGGGLTLGSAINSSGLAGLIGSISDNLTNTSIIVVTIVSIISIIILTELTSNTATVSTFIPILGATALGLGENPLMLIVPATLAASCAFMMPVATPPNAIAYASGYLKMKHMIRAGIWLNLISFIIILFIISIILGPVFEVKIGELPDWINN